jgi:hypothetical protein
MLRRLIKGEIGVDGATYICRPVEGDAHEHLIGIAEDVVASGVIGLNLAKPGISAK